MIRLPLAAAAAAFLGLSASCGASTPEPPRKVERIVAFGDSFADDGNIFRLVGTRPPPLYPKGRFSDGTNFVDTMSALLGAPVVNFALGGAVTGEGDRDFRPAGLDLQTRAFLAGGGTLGFPKTGGRFAAGDLVVLSIGGNDARAYGKRFGLAPGERQLAVAIREAPAAADRSAANTERALLSLVGAGARNILFLGGDVGRLPEVRGRPAAKAGSAFSARYNERVRAALARLSAGGQVIARYVDMDALARRVEADPAAFGLASAGACPQACVRDPKLAARYLFYVDKVHLTQAGFAILGRHAVERWRAPR